MTEVKGVIAVQLDKELGQIRTRMTIQQFDAQDPWAQQCADVVAGMFNALARLDGEQNPDPPPGFNPLAGAAFCLTPDDFRVIVESLLCVAHLRRPSEEMRGEAMSAVNRLAAMVGHDEMHQLLGVPCTNEPDA
jgi:hypothetical protein